MSGSILLEAGKRYYIELLNKNGGGGDGSSVAFRSADDPNVPPATEFIGAPNLELPKGPPSVASITPSSLTIEEGGYANFSVKGIGGAAPYLPRWFKGTAEVPGSVGKYAMRVGPFQCSDTSVTFLLSNSWMGTRVVVPVTITPDTNKPALYSASGDGSLTKIFLKFSERMDPLSAASPANYSIPGLTVLGATMPANDVVTLTTTRQEEGVTYAVTINNVKDGACAANLLDPVTVPFTAWIISSGACWREYYTGLGSDTIASLVSNSKFINHLPDTTELAPTAFSPDGWGDNYGVVVYGYFQPPVNGTYTFFFRHDDGGELWISSDDTKEKAVRVLAAGCCHSAFDAAFVANISMVGGRRYYFEARVKEAGGGDYLSVGVRTPLDNPTALPAGPMSGSLIACRRRSQFIEHPAPRRCSAAYKRDGRSRKLIRDLLAGRDQLSQLAYGLCLAKVQYCQ